MTQEALALAQSVGETLPERGLTLAVAESCTGGGLAAQIVAVPGSSDYFRGGVIAYANDIKSGLLGVLPDTLESHGAVSWQTAIQMAQGVRALFDVDLALSTTGIAGPTGGTPIKPVGTVYLALASPDGTWWERQQWEGSRNENNASSIQASLSLLTRYLESPEHPLQGSEAVESGQAPTTRQILDGPISVETAAHGQSPRVLAFVWKEQRYVVERQGRTWQDQEGGWHVLVMGRPRGTFELVQDRTGQWHVGRAWLGPLVA